MRLGNLFIATSLAVGCRASTPAAPVAGTAARSDRASATPASDPLTYCRIAVTAIDELGRCRGTDTFAAMRAQYVELTEQPPPLPKKSGAMCATLLEHLIVDPEVEDCAFTFRERRAEIGAALDAYYAERVQLEPTGHAGADDVLGELAAHRDAVCACTNQACVRRLANEDVWANPKPLPRDAPARARELGSLIIDDIGKCSGDARFARPR